MRLAKTIILGAVFICVNPGARADISLFMPSTGHIHLLATGLDAKLEPNKENNELDLHFEGSLALFDSASVTSYGGNLVDHHA